MLRVTDAVAEIGFDRSHTTVGEVLTGIARFAQVRDIHLSEPDLAAVLRTLYAQAAGQ